MVRREAVAGRVDPAVKREIEAAIEEAGIDESEFVRRSVATYFRENPDNLELLQSSETLEEFWDRMFDALWP